MTQDENNKHLNPLILQQYNQTLHMIYDELYEMNITDDTYQMIYHTEHKYVSPPTSGCTSSNIKELTKNTIHPEDQERFSEFFNIDRLGKVFQTGQEKVIGEFRKLWDDGEFHWVVFTVVHAKERKDKVIYLCFIMDMAPTKHREETIQLKNELKYRAEYDLLTGIYNQKSFELHVANKIKEDIGHSYAVIRMDINRFKYINDLYGMETGNKALKCIAHLLQKHVGQYGICGRSNSDIFNLCVCYKTTQELVTLVKLIQQELDICSSGHGIKISASFGICLVQDRLMSVNLLCDRAHLALKSIKGNVVTTWAFYDEKLRAQQMEEREIENEMQDALKNKEFIIYLQPKHDILTGKIVGAESLVRWKHPKKGLIPPLRFIPLFEKNGFIIHLDEYVWEETCKLLRKWLDLGREVVSISVNVSRVDIYHMGFCDTLERLMRTYHIPPGLLELEVTESTFTEKTKELYDIIKKMEEKGFRISMDDFGTGYSSLIMLKDAPISVIKFDQDFLNESTISRKGEIVVKHMVEMVKELGLSVVAEGVETAQQAEVLLKAGCLVAQGYFFSKPMPIAEFEEKAYQNK